jgi:hypothetical protein
MRLATHYSVVVTIQHQTIVYNVGVRATFMRLGLAQKVVLLACTSTDTGDWLERDLTPAFRAFQRRALRWLAWRYTLRKTFTPRRLLQREAGQLPLPRRLDLLLDEGYHQERDRRARARQHLP